jgi:hypothetical protein
MIPRFHIFSGTLKGNKALWMGCDNDLEKAQEIMMQEANRKRGPYFVLSTTENKVISGIDTTDEPLRWRVHTL